MQRILIAKECFRELRQIPLDTRKGLVSSFLKLFETNDVTGLSPIKAGDRHTFTFNLGAEQQVLVRFFPEEPQSLVWMTIAPKERMEFLAKSLRFSWDGETTRLIRVEPNSGKIQDEKPFARYAEQEFRALGIPANLVGKLSAIHSLEDLQELEGDLTPRIYSHLIELWEENQNLESDLEILHDKISEKEQSRLEDEISQSLDDPFHSDRFCLLETQEPLQKMTTLDLPSWMFFPSPDQKKWLTRNFKGPVLLRGVSGCGKSAIALLRAKYLAQELLAENSEWILVATPFHHCAKFLEEDMRNLGGVNTERVEINHIYGWAASYLNELGPVRETNNTLALEYLKEAIDSCRAGMSNITPSHLDFNFVREEIAYVIKGRALYSQPEYLAIPRKGFGSPLSGEERRQIWRIYLKYQEILANHQLMDAADLLVEAYRKLAKEPAKRKYASIILDDVQDMPPIALKIFSLLVQGRPNGLFLLSDVTQKHTRTGDLLSNLGIQLSMRSPLLRSNLRSTLEIAELGTKVLGPSRLEELDGSGASQNVQPEVTRKGSKPVLRFHETEEQEILWILDLIGELTSEAYGYQFGDIALMARSNRHLTVLELNLNQAQIPVVNFKKVGHVRFSNQVKICSYSDCQGMEFPVVILTEVIDNIIPSIPAAIDAEELNAHLNRERSLLFMGINRAKEMLYISGSEGEPSRFLTPILESTSTSSEESPSPSTQAVEQKELLRN